MLDRAYLSFDELKPLLTALAEAETSTWRLAAAAHSAQRRANALKNLVIPKHVRISHFISDSLEEKEREEFSRLKVVKRTRHHGPLPPGGKG